MKFKIDMIGIITSQLPQMRDFYKDVLGLSIKLEMEHYIEFEHEGVRFALSTHHVLKQATGDEGYDIKPSGHSLELAFKFESVEELEEAYKFIISNGAKEIKKPEDMPWGQRTGFFADPDGNIHELFCDL